MTDETKPTEETQPVTFTDMSTGQPYVEPGAEEPAPASIPWAGKTCPVPGVLFMQVPGTIMKARGLQIDEKGVQAEGTPELVTAWPPCNGPVCHLWRDGDCLVAGALGAVIVLAANAVARSEVGL